MSTESKLKSTEEFLKLEEAIEKQKKLKMGYGWTNEVDLIAAQDWISIDNFTRLLSQLEGINYSVKSQRDNALEMMNNSRTIAPFGEKQRFPDKGAWMHLYTYPQLGLWTDIKQLLGISDRASEVGLPSATSSADTLARRDRNYHDQHKSYTEKLKALKNLVVPNESIEQMATRGIYIQLTFEKEYSLTWAG
uniref:Coat protein n=1 Tax=Rubber tree latent virus 2 TaxID=3079710 RepID=A0AA96PX87_9VIRU|nr:coat protein [Rubber tree latent virus 2]